MLVYNENNGKYNVYDELYQVQAINDNGTRIVKKIASVHLETFDNELEAQAFIKMQENMILKLECEESLSEEYEYNLEKEPGWTACP